MSGLCGCDEKPSRILFRERNLFLTQKIQVGVTAGARIDDGGKVPRKIVGVTSCVCQGKRKGDLQRACGAPMALPSFQGWRKIVTSPREATAYKNDLPSRAKVVLNVTTPGSNETHFLSEMDTS